MSKSHTVGDCGKEITRGGNIMSVGMNRGNALCLFLDSFSSHWRVKGGGWIILYSLAMKVTEMVNNKGFNVVLTGSIS